MICMSTSLPISIKLPNRSAGCGVPVGTCRVPCAAANDATANISTHPHTTCVNRFIEFPSYVSTKNSILTSYSCIGALQDRQQTPECHLVRHAYAHGNGCLLLPLPPEREQAVSKANLRNA